MAIDAFPHYGGYQCMHFHFYSPNAQLKEKDWRSENLCHRYHYFNNRVKGPRKNTTDFLQIKCKLFLIWSACANCLICALRVFFHTVYKRVAYWFDNLVGFLAVDSAEWKKKKRDLFYREHFSGSLSTCRTCWLLLSRQNTRRQADMIRSHLWRCRQFKAYYGLSTNIQRISLSRRFRDRQRILNAHSSRNSAFQVPKQSLRISGWVCAKRLFWICAK